MDKNQIYRIFLILFLAILTFIIIDLWLKIRDFIVIGDSVYAEIAARVLSLKHKVLRIRSHLPQIRKFQFCDEEETNYYSLCEPEEGSFDTLTEEDLETLSEYFKVEVETLYRMSFDSPITNCNIETMVVSHLPITKFETFYSVLGFATPKLIFCDAEDPQIGDILVCENTEVGIVTEDKIIQIDEPENDYFFLQTPRPFIHHDIKTIHPFHFPPVSEPLTAVSLISYLVSEQIID